MYIIWQFACFDRQSVTITGKLNTNQQIYTKLLKALSKWRHAL